MLSFVLMLIAVAMLVYTVFNYKSKRSRMVMMVNKFNGPKTIPFFGNAFLFACSPEEAIQKALKIWSDLESPIRVWLFHRPVVCIFSLDDIQILLNKEVTKSDYYHFVSDALGDGLLTSKVEKWKLHRRIINPAFHKLSLLKKFIEIFHRHTLTMTKKLKKEVGTKNMFDLWPYVSSTTICTICETAMGYDAEVDTEVLEFGEAIITIGKLIFKRITSPWLYPSFMFNLWKNTFKDYSKTKSIIVNFTSKVLKAKREEIMSQKYENKEEEDESSKNFLDLLLHSPEVKENFTDQDIIDEILIIMFGGSETSAITNCFLLLMLAMNPDIQDTVYNEIYSVFGDSSRSPDSEDLKKLPYLEQCIKETLRCFPPVPIIGRIPAQDIKLTDGSVIPAGVDILISPLAVHWDPSNYSDPLVWNPDNFDDQIQRHRCAFLPFSFGVRGCIGAKYAMISMKEQISTILRNFKVSTKITMDDLVYTIDILFRSKNGYPIQLEYRHGKSIF